MVKQTAAADH